VIVLQKERVPQEKSYSPKSIFVGKSMSFKNRINGLQGFSDISSSGRNLRQAGSESSLCSKIVGIFEICVGALVFGSVDDAAHATQTINETETNKIFISKSAADSPAGACTFRH
jgi:hypothetical protein